MARLAARDTGVSETTATVPELLAFIGSLGALGVLILVVYDTALLYNLGRLDDRLPLALAAAVVLLGVRWAASRLTARPSSPGLSLAFVRHALRHWLTLFFVPALAVRYGIMFGTRSLPGEQACCWQRLHVRSPDGMRWSRYRTQVRPEMKATNGADSTLLCWSGDSAAQS